MERGTFANVRIRNRLAPGTEGGYTTHLPTGEVTTVFEAAQQLPRRGDPARHHRREGVRLRLEPRLGRQGPAPPGRASRHRRELRADPPLEPGRDGHPPAPVRGGRERRGARADRTRSLQCRGAFPRDRDRLRERPRRPRPRPRRRRDRDQVQRDRPHRHAAGSRYYRHGGILQYVLRQLLRGRDRPVTISGTVSAVPQSRPSSKPSDEEVDENSIESFPASDSPTY